MNNGGDSKKKKKKKHARQPDEQRVALKGLSCDMDNMVCGIRVTVQSKLKWEGDFVTKSHSRHSRQGAVHDNQSRNTPDKAASASASLAKLESEKSIRAKKKKKKIYLYINIVNLHPLRKGTRKEKFP